MVRAFWNHCLPVVCREVVSAPAKVKVAQVIDRVLQDQWEFLHSTKNPNL